MLLQSETESHDTCTDIKTKKLWTDESTDEHQDHDMTPAIEGYKSNYFYCM